MSKVLTQMPLQHFEYPDSHEDGHLNGTDASSLPSPQSSSKKEGVWNKKKSNGQNMKPSEEVGQDSGAQVSAEIWSAHS